MRVVLDTNALVSAILSPHGPPRQLLDGARQQRFALCSSPVLIAELLDVMLREKFASRLNKVGLTPLAIVRDIRRIAHIESPNHVPRVIADDADDDHVLACAMASRADLIVSGDKHLHSLGGHYQGVPIVRPAEAVSIIAAWSRA